MFYRQGLKGGICKSSGIGCFRFLKFWLCVLLVCGQFALRFLRILCKDQNRPLCKDWKCGEQSPLCWRENAHAEVSRLQVVGEVGGISLVPGLQVSCQWYKNPPKAHLIPCGSSSDSPRMSQVVEKSWEIPRKTWEFFRKTLEILGG